MTIIEQADEMIRKYLDPDGVYNSSDITDRDAIIADLTGKGWADREIAAFLFRRFRELVS